MAPLKILISGGGISGNTLAFWLSRLGHNVTVVEWFSCLRITGLQLDLRGHGVEVMKRMGLEQAFRSVKAPEQGFEIVDKNGKCQAFFPANTSGKGVQDFTTEWEIMRGDLCRMIYNETKDVAKYMFGTSIEEVENNTDAVHVRFTDGREDEFDLVVGAEGQGSRLRKMMIGEDAESKALTPLGGYVAYFRIPKDMQPGEDFRAKWYLATNSRFVMTRRHNDREMQVYLICTSRADEIDKSYRRGISEEKKAYRKVFANAGWKVDEYLEVLEATDDFYCERVSFVRLSPWSQGRIALVGDAAYCPSVMTGMGTTSAIVGAYILAGEIGKRCAPTKVSTHQDLVDALQAYEKTYRPFMDQVQRGLSEGGWAYWPTSSFGIWIVNHLARLAAALRLNVVGGWFLREKVDNWQLPTYEVEERSA
ncbi:uncharacterized protein PV09_08715 [Verruconis gallopava]|uniref:FAD-binding domain-containing protein n=1 Tax=Verruconis gallopava TaxID=253628 RepID=A0A0D1XBR6_9PEZI|nr:uncharacterized protein PV09_08715 [Verruconis gallopava]KIV99660.1 hypothetical protein PV09_08715 [Verruconis gallopava]